MITEAYVKKLEDRVKYLEEALLIHVHTQECFNYAAKTAARHGNAHCVARCADSYRRIMGPIRKKEAEGTLEEIICHFCGVEGMGPGKFGTLYGISRNKVGKICKKHNIKVRRGRLSND